MDTPKSQPGLHIKPYQPDEFNQKANILKKKLPPELISYRKGAGGARLAYLEGWRAISLANEIFGFNGWSSTIQNMTVDYNAPLYNNIKFLLVIYSQMDVSPDGRISLGLSSVVRITLKDGTMHEDVGYGTIENAKSKSMAFEKAKKEAATDGLKRALRMFGDVLGNCLYNRNYVGSVGKFSKKREAESYNEDDLYRVGNLDNPIKQIAINPYRSPAHQPIHRNMQTPSRKAPAVNEGGVNFVNHVPAHSPIKPKNKAQQTPKKFSDVENILSQDDFEWEDTLDEIIGIIEYESAELDDIDYDISTVLPDNALYQSNGKKTKCEETQQSTVQTNGGLNINETSFANTNVASSGNASTHLNNDNSNERRDFNLSNNFGSSNNTFANKRGFNNSAPNTQNASSSNGNTTTGFAKDSQFSTNTPQNPVPSFRNVTHGSAPSSNGNNTTSNVGFMPASKLHK
ncbi:hypothetical protein BB558_001009 [Smittium angustum]|uniref:DNA repair and recombination protein RAD52 n=1 Tax=Smittium angustum TaxID=133377 RepID=A0A2U1JCJ9_SMIAN|nr:hypothetical protein BB558_001009 [Smittium angustum]